MHDMPHSKGFRSKTRKVLRKKGNNKGLSCFLQNYKINDKVVITIDPSQVKGMPHRRYQGKVGSVKEVNRRSLAVEIQVGNKIKKIIARWEHIKPYS
jgi:large subunit ribosomal protein L21e